MKQHNLAQAIAFAMLLMAFIPVLAVTTSRIRRQPKEPGANL